MIIIVSGCVGTGKTALAKKLTKKLNYKYVDVNSLIKKNRLYDSYDRKVKSYIVDVKKLNKFLIKFIKNNENKSLIIDSHMAHYLPKKYVDICIITKCNLKILNKRLKMRKYSSNKIKENIEAEIFDVCFEEAREGGYKPIIIETSKKVDINKIIKILK